MAYLSIDEESTYIDVFCDGYVLRIYEGSGSSGDDNVGRLYETDAATLIGGITNRIATSGGSIRFAYDNARIVEVIENTPTRIGIRVTGIADTGYGATQTELANTDGLQFIFYIYQDRIAVSMSLVVTGAGITVSNDASNQYTIGLTLSSGTGADTFQESSDSEIDLSTYSSWSGDYALATVDEMNGQLILLDSDGSPLGRSRSEAIVAVAWNDVVLTADTYTMSVLFIIDSAEREGWTGHNNQQKVDDDEWNDDVLLYWNGEGTALGISQDGSTLTISGVDYVTGVDGVASGAAEIVDDNDQVYIACTNNINAEKGFISLWYKFTGSGTAYRVLLDYSPDLAFRYSTAAAGSTVSLSYNEDDYTLDIPNSLDVLDGEWHLFELSYDSTTDIISFWMDGVLGETDTDFTTAPPTITGGNLHIGNRDSNARPCEGVIDELYISSNPNPKKYTSVERLEIGDQYKDQTWPIAGQVTDLNIPANIGSDGLASDGAWHMDANSKNKGKMIVDTVRHDPVFEIENWNIRTGDLASYDEHLIGHWKCDDNAASLTVIDEQENFTSAMETSNTSAVSVTGTRGTALYVFEEVISLGVYDVSNWMNDFTIIIKVKPDHLISNVRAIWSLYPDVTDIIEISYSPSEGIRATFTASIDGTAISHIATGAFSSLNKLQQWHTLMLCVSLTNNYATFYIDGECIGTNELTGSWGTTPTIQRLNYARWAYNTGESFYDEVKLFNGCLLPYGGGPMTGNGEVDTDVAHEDIGFYWDTENDTPGIGGDVFTSKDGSYVEGGPTGSYYDNESNANSAQFALTSAHIDPNEGAISFWFNLPSVVVGDRLFGIFGSTVADNALNCRVTTGDILEFRYNSTDDGDGSILESSAISAGIWYYAICRWSQSLGIIELILDGVSQGTDAILNPWAGATSATLYVCEEGDGTSGIDAWIAGFYITNNPYTPDRWSVFGKPVYMPMLKKNGIYQQYGADMNAVMTPDASVLITDLGEVS